MAYLAKNIREGYNIDQVREILKSYSLEGKKLYIEVRSFNHSRDSYGNSTAHYVANLVIESDSQYLHPCTIVASGSRREQIGYDSKNNEAALCALEKLGYELERVGHGGPRSYDSPITYKIINLEV